MKMLFLPVAAIALAMLSSPTPNPRIKPFAVLRGVDVALAVPVPNTNRVYYTTRTKELWLYDRSARQSTLVARGEFESSINVSPNGDRLVFARSSEDNKVKQLWALPLSLKTGLASGPARRLTVGAASGPAVSPDGKRIAYVRYDDSAHYGDIVVMPSTGGPERIVQRVDGWVLPMRWNPDGASIVYGVEPMPKGRRMHEATYRISSDSGAATLIVNASANWPGLSPDGRLIAVTRDTCDSLLVMDANGHPLAQFELAGPGVGGEWYHWSANDRFMVFTRNTPHLLTTMSLGDGKKRVVSDPRDPQEGPIEFVWSPDGKRIAARYQGSRGGVLVMNSDGSNKHVFPTKELWPVVLTWSPDGRFLSYYTAFARAGGGFNVMDATNGRETNYGHAPNYADPVWSGDSRAVYWTAFADTLEQNKPVGRVNLFKGTLDGTTSLVRVDTLPRAAALFPGKDGARISADTSGDVFMYPAERGARRKLGTLGRGFVTIPSFSRDGEWMAFRRNPDGPDGARAHRLELMRTDGSRHVSIDLPFNAIRGPGNPAFFPDPNMLVVSGQDAPGGEISCYLVNVTSREIKKLMTISTAYAFVSRCLPSPDGKTVLFNVDDEPTSTFADVDLSDLTNRVALKSHRK
jgi:Tol biopolymer transport system component